MNSTIYQNKEFVNVESDGSTSNNLNLKEKYFFYANAIQYNVWSFPMKTRYVIDGNPKGLIIKTCTWNDTQNIIYIIFAYTYIFFLKHCMKKNVLYSFYTFLDIPACTWLCHLESWMNEGTYVLWGLTWPPLHKCWMWTHRWMPRNFCCWPPYPGKWPPVYYSSAWTAWWCCWSSRTGGCRGDAFSHSEKSPAKKTILLYYWEV